MNRTVLSPLSCVLVVLTCGVLSADTWSDQAAAILDSSGVRGGLIVHIGCGDGRLTAALHPGDSYLVHGLDADAANVARAREHIRAIGLYGEVSVDRLRGDALPYIDNLANLVVSEDLGTIPMPEVLRILAPNGVAYVKRNGDWARTVKPRPGEIDEWNHFLHGPDNNAVADDSLVAPPQHIQWVGEPRWARHHNYLSSTSAVVSSGARLFAIVDEGPVASIAFPSQWVLIARDAFNGVVLWKRPIALWEGHLRPFRSGPPDLSRRLVAVGDLVFVTLGYGEPVTALDAATGRTVSTYAGTEGALEIIHDAGVLYVVTAPVSTDPYADAARVSEDFASIAARRGASPPPRSKRITAVAADTGEVKWTVSDEHTSELFPTTLCLGGGRIFFQTPTAVVCLDLASGQQLWRASRPVGARRLAWSTPTLVIHDGVVLSADRAVGPDETPEPGEPVLVQWNVTSGTGSRDLARSGEMVALSAEDGSRLWSCRAGPGYNSPPDVFVADGLVWVGTPPEPDVPPFTEGRDPRTGEIKRRLETAKVWAQPHHHRCHRNKATSRYIITGRAGVEFIGLAGDEPRLDSWVRGACQYGAMPCNGLLYTPPHSCACYIQSKLTGFRALAPARRESQAAGAPRLERGPAYGTAMAGEESAPDWPTYRGDPARSAFTATSVPANLKPAWESDLGGKLTSVVVAEGKLFVAQPDLHALDALDANSGKQLWTCTAGGRIDSPPTIHKGLALFGSADGYVYCLRASDGELVWRFRAAPEDRRTVAYGQVESVWPVPGSVLLVDDVVYCAAGRSSYLDGGMRLCRIDAATGRLLGETRLDYRDPETGEQSRTVLPDVDLPGALPDVLSCDGASIYLRDIRFDTEGVEQEPNVPHLYSSVGFVDDEWWHRTYWIFGTNMFGRARNWFVMGNNVPSGRILALDGSSVYGFGRRQYSGSHLGLERSLHHLFKADRAVAPSKKMMGTVGRAAEVAASSVSYRWSREVPFVVRAMVLAGDTLFVAGPPWAEDPASAVASFEQGKGAVLAAVSAKDGSTLAEHKLDAVPAFDGMAAANGRLYLSTTTGTVLCLTD